MAAVLDMGRSDERARWVVVDADGVPIAESSRFLNFCFDREDSDHTIRAYALDLRLYFDFLARSGTPRTAVTREVLAAFIAYLRKPVVRTSGPRRGEVWKRSPHSVNRTMSAVGSFYRFLGESSGDPTHARLASASSLRRAPRVTVVDGVAGASSRLERRSVVPKLKAAAQPLEVLTIPQVHAIVAACANRRDALLFSMLFLTGLRIDQALGLRHSDFSVPDLSVTVRRRDQRREVHHNKSVRSAVIPIPRNLARLYLDYMYEEYGDIDSDYIFVNLWNGAVGAPMTYSNVVSQVKAISRRAEVYGWTPHTLRHTYVSCLSDAGVSIDVISHLVTHASIRTTVETYQHLNVEHLRQHLIEKGLWDE